MWRACERDEKDRENVGLEDGQRRGGRGDSGRKWETKKRWNEAVGIRLRRKELPSL